MGPLLLAITATVTFHPGPGVDNTRVVRLATGSAPNQTITSCILAEPCTLALREEKERLQVVDEDLFAPPLTVRAGETIALPLYRLRSVRWHGSAAISSLSAYAFFPPEAGFPQVPLRCEQKGETLTCLVPDGPVMIGLQSGEKSPRFFSPAELFKKPSPLAFDEKPTVFGFLSTEEGTPLRGKVKLRKPRGEELLTEAHSLGFYQFSSLPPGDYVLEVSFSNLGCFPQLLTLLPREGKRADLLLRPVARLAVFVTPPTTPEGFPFAVEVRSTKGDGFFRRPTDPAGYLELVVPQGDAEVKILSQQEQAGEWITWWRKKYNFQANTEEHIAMTLQTAKGRLAMQREDLQAEQICFSQLSEETSSGIPQKVLLYHRCVPVSKGTFTLHFFEEGSYNFQVMARSGTPLCVGEVHVRANEVLELACGGLGVTGRCVDKNKKPVAGARIFVVSGDGKSFHGALSDSDGRFSLFGLEPKKYRLFASQGELKGAAEVKVDKDAEAVEIVLSPQQYWEGQVMGQGRPVAGAKVELFPSCPLSLGSQTGTDVEGKFSLPADACGGGTLLISAPPWPLGVFPAQPGTFELAQPAGNLRIVAATPSVFDPQTPGAVIKDGLRLHVFALVSWAAMQGQRPANGVLLVPNLPAGRYTLCVGSLPTQGHQCSTVELRPGRDAEVQLP